MNLSKTRKTKASLKKNDQVQVIAGREKGKIGKITRVDALCGRVVVENLNQVRKTKKRTETSEGGIFLQDHPIDVSNVLLYCTVCARGVRHGIQVVAVSASAGAEKSDAVAGSPANVNLTKVKKIRVCKRCKNAIDPA